MMCAGPRFGIDAAEEVSTRDMFRYVEIESRFKALPAWSKLAACLDC